MLGRIIILTNAVLFWLKVKFLLALYDRNFGDLKEGYTSVYNISEKPVENS